MKMIAYDFSEIGDVMDAPEIRMIEVEKRGAPAACDHPFRVPGDTCLNCGEEDNDVVSLRARIRELDRQLEQFGRDLAFKLDIPFERPVAKGSCSYLEAVEEMKERAALQTAALIASKDVNAELERQVATLLALQEGAVVACDELKAQLAAKESTIADLRDADKRAVKIAAEEADRQTEGLRAQLATMFSMDDLAEACRGYKRESEQLRREYDRLSEQTRYIEAQLGEAEKRWAIERDALVSQRRAANDMADAQCDRAEKAEQEAAEAKKSEAALCEQVGIMTRGNIRAHEREVKLRAALEAIMVEEKFSMLRWSKDTRAKIIQAPIFCGDDMWQAALNPPEQPAPKGSKPLGEVVFEHHGGIYNRPLGRGICGDDEEGEEFYLEEKFPDGWFEADIVIRKRPEPPATEGEPK